MKAVVVALVVVFAACDNKPEPKLGAGASASSGSGSAAPAEAAPPVAAAPAERPAAIDTPTHERFRRELEQLKQRRDRVLEITHPSAASATAPEQLCAALHTMDDLVTKLSIPGNLTSHSEECKAIRELEKQSNALPDRRFIDLELEDIVDGRCGLRVMATREDLQIFYEKLHKTLGEQLKQCGP